MSFICQKCKKAQPVHSKPNRVVLSTRKKVYPERRNKDYELIDRGGEGEEIESETRVCDGCYAVYQEA